ncbi:hypothetical protein CES86_1017 [Brucella lupini]|uniref:Uncharacterized protein n=1 Tax=Brucella lupini TaxID=255457 RepID=A0A256GWD3_9HYPH|nr:hypothetical protein CES86_1017 [Brucella lupini]
MISKYQYTEENEVLAANGKTPLFHKSSVLNFRMAASISRSWRGAG